MMDPELRDDLKMLAIRRGIKFADVLDKVLREYLDKEE